MTDKPTPISVGVYGTTVVKVFETWTEVTLPSGKVVTGTPTRDQLPMARHIGYGDDLTRMCLEHDPMHARLCEFLGLPQSYALRRAAGQWLSHDEEELAGMEEDAVLAVLRFRTHWRTLYGRS